MWWIFGKMIKVYVKWIIFVKAKYNKYKKKYNSKYIFKNGLQLLIYIFMKSIITLCLLGLVLCKYIYIQKY